MQSMQSSASAFAGVSGVLGGFSIALVTLLLAHNEYGKRITRMVDWIVAIGIVAAGLYIITAGLLANCIAILGSDFEGGIIVYNRSICLFHFTNILLLAAFALLARVYSLRVGFVAAIVATVLVSLIALINIVSWCFWIVDG